MFCVIVTETICSTCVLKFSLITLYIAGIHLVDPAIFLDLLFLSGIAIEAILLSSVTNPLVLPCEEAIYFLLSLLEAAPH